MIQRIQTVYLFAAAALMLCLLWFPFYEILALNPQNVLKIYHFHASGIVDAFDCSQVILPTFVLKMLLWFSTVAIFASIFFYNNRRLQMRLCYLNILIIITLAFFAWSRIHAVMTRFGGVDAKILVYTAFPVIAIIFIYLAFLGIKKDENLIRSLNRIR